MNADSYATNVNFALLTGSPVRSLKREIRCEYLRKRARNLHIFRGSLFNVTRY